MKTLLIARLTLRRMLRSYYLMPVGLMALVVVMVYLGTARAAGNDPHRLVQAASWSLMLITDIFLYIGSIFLVVTIVPDEVVTGHMRMNLTKPASGFSVLLGHFLGMFAYLAAASLVLAGILTVAIVIKGGDPGLLVFGYILHLLPLYGCLLAGGLALVFLFNRPLAFFILFFLAKEEWLYEKAAMCAQPFPIKQALQAVYYGGYLIAPPLSRFDLSIAEFQKLIFPYDKYLLVLAYCAIYMLIALLISEALLRRRDV